MKRYIISKIEFMPESSKNLTEDNIFDTDLNADTALFSFLKEKGSKYPQTLMEFKKEWDGNTNSGTWGNKPFTYWEIKKS